MKVDRDVYAKVVRDVILLLRGRATDVMHQIKSDMMAAASQRNYELAAALRDKMFALDKIIEKQVVVSSDLLDRDIIAFERNEHRAVMTLLVVRNGYLLGSRHFEFAETLSSPAESIEDFIRQYYEKMSFVPSEILIQEKIESLGLLEGWLKGVHAKRVRIIVPQRGEKAEPDENGPPKCAKPFKRNPRRCPFRSSLATTAKASIGIVIFSKTHRMC